MNYFKNFGPPYAVGAGIGILNWFAFATVDHPIGITTACEHLVALAIQAVDPDIINSHAYYQNPENTPVIGWEWVDLSLNGAKEII